MNINLRRKFLQNADEKDLKQYFYTLQRVAKYKNTYSNILKNDVGYLKQYGGDNDCDIKKDFGTTFGSTGRQRDNISADMIVICLQESSGFGDSILDSFRKCYQEYCKISDESILSVGKEGFRGLRTFILLKKTINKSFFTIEINHIRTLSKGSICTMLNWKNLSLSFMNSHLSFKKNKGTNQGLEERKNDFESFYTDHYTKLGENFTKSLKFFIGDLNFRNNNCEHTYVSSQIAQSKSFQNIIPNIYKNCDQLYQLLNSKDEKDKFYTNFTEGVRKNIQNGEGIKFEPTCKLKKGRQNNQFKYDLHPNEYDRTPSWCDRILYSKNLTNEFFITCFNYDSIDSGLTFQSDHSLVYGYYEIFNSTRYKKPFINNNMFYPKKTTLICNELDNKIYNYFNSVLLHKTEYNFKENFIDKIDNIFKELNLSKYKANSKNYRGRKKLSHCLAKTVLLRTNELLSKKRKNITIFPEENIDILAPISSYFNLQEW
jgi:hypothetical protein